VFAELIESARELRNPLVLGYAALFSLWIWLGESVADTARRSDLGVRLLDGLHSLGSASELALVSFVAAMIGSVLWSGGVSRLVAWLMRRLDHPDWDQLVSVARARVQRYEEYEVVTQRGNPSFGTRHKVPSPHWGEYLNQQAEDRARKASEVTFRVTLAMAILPVALSLAIEGDGTWWLTFLLVAFPWLDVALMKHSMLRVVRGYRIQDLTAKLDQLHNSLSKTTDETHRSRLQADIQATEVELDDLRAEQRRPATRFFSRIAA
jgi:hypothetical protein